MTANRTRRHLLLTPRADTRPYRPQPGGGSRSAVTPRPDRTAHADALLAQIQLALNATDRHVDPELVSEQRGHYLQVTLSAGSPIDTAQSLEDRGRAVEIAALTESPAGQLIATVLVPDRASHLLTQKVTAYRDRDDPRSQRPQNEKLVARTDAVSQAHLTSLYVGDPQQLPARDEVTWWEVWLRKGSRAELIRLAHLAELTVSERQLSFPEREVVLVRASLDGLDRIFRNSIVMTEFRRFLETPSVFTRMNPVEQTDWARDFEARVTPAGQDDVAVLILDGGVNNGHPLLRRHLADEDRHAWHADWTTTDMRGHGTEMAGAALHGDLSELLPHTTAVTVPYRLESMKLLPDHGQHPEDMYGAVTAEAITRVESLPHSQHRRRVVCMAITSQEETTGGRPTGWSSALDQLASGADLTETPRLIVVSAGNIRDAYLPHEFPDRNDLEQIESPAQAWNVLTVGAFTDRTDLTDPDFAGYAPVAPTGDLTPTSRTSQMFESQWPIKPDVVLEGGNFISDGTLPLQPHDDVAILTTSHRNMTSFVGFGETSAATALASRLAAHLMADNPDYWPETVRGLLIHSAEWTEAMRRSLPGTRTTDKRARLRRYGYGVPSLERARRSASNDLTLITQDHLRPFRRDGSETRLNDLKVYSFPWDALDLQALQGLDVELRVTLSYFIEPNPSPSGRSDMTRHQYASHNLRFEVSSLTETADELHRRVQRELLNADEVNLRGNSIEGWALGPNLRRSGSVHSDTWCGSVEELLQRRHIAVFPARGWWRELRGDPPHWNKDARYALIVSLRALEADVDIYTPVAVALQVGIEI